MINWKEAYPNYKTFVNMKDQRILVLVQRVTVHGEIFNGTDHSLILPATFVWNTVKDCAKIRFSNILGYWIDLYEDADFKGHVDEDSYINIKTEYVGMPEYYNENKSMSSDFKIISWTLMKDIL